MAKANPTRPDAPADEERLHDAGDLPETDGRTFSDDVRSDAADDESHERR